MKLKIKTYTKLIVMISSLISICLVLFIAINANYYITRMSRNNSELYSAYRISELLKSFRSTIITLDNKQKGYIITGDSKFLEEYKIKETEAKVFLKNMEKYFYGKADEQAFDRLRDLTYKKLNESKDVGRNLAGFSGGQDNSEEAGIKTLDDIKSVIDEINESLSKNTQVLIDNSITYVKTSKNWSFLEVAIGIIAAIAALLILFRDINVRNSLENELRIAKKQADENALMKEQFMANMSHEIRTPMNAILGFSGLLQKTRLDNTQTEYLHAIKTSGTNLLNIINDILDFSKIEAGKLHVEKIAFDVLSLLDSLRVMFAEKAREKQIAFDIILDDRIPQFIFGDPTRLTQILVNLVNNAVKFTAQGGVKLICEVRSMTHDSAVLVFRVKDTGIGIPADKMSGVFERFNQGNKETTRKYGGTGLGLAIVKSLVESQNGDIKFKSKEGAGTEFIVALTYPISYENIIAAEEPMNMQHLSNGSHTVLLAEDNALNQKLACTYLEGFGLNVEVAENGQAAVEKLRRNRYDVVLMDIQMPVLDGYNATAKIRSELKLDTPVIAMTAHIMPGEREKCISYGMNDYISKPFKEADLHALINKYIDNSAIYPVTYSHSIILQNPNMNKNAKHPVVDLQDLYDLARGNKAFIKEMIEIFLDQNPADLKDIEQAIAKTNFETIRTVAHKMKTSLGFMGMKPLLELLAEMELLAGNKESMPRIKVLYKDLKTSCEKGVAELKNILTTLEKEV